MFSTILALGLTALFLDQYIEKHFPDPYVVGLGGDSQIAGYAPVQNNAYTFANSTSDAKISQGFTATGCPSGTCDVHNIIAYIYKSDGSDATVRTYTCGIYGVLDEHSNGTMNGSYCTNSFAADSISSNILLPTTVNFTCSSTYPNVQAGVQYAIQCNGTSTANISMKARNPGGAYTGGQLAYFNSGAWVNQSDGDFAFSLEGIQVTGSVQAFCAGVQSVQFKANLSRGTFNATTKRYTELNMVPVNQTVCTYYIDNTLISSVYTYNVTTNLTTQNITLRANGNAFNSTNPYQYNVSAAQNWTINFTMNLTNVTTTAASIPFNVNVTGVTA